MLVTTDFKLNYLQFDIGWLSTLHKNSIKLMSKFDENFYLLLVLPGLEFHHIFLCNFLLRIWDMRKIKGISPTDIFSFEADLTALIPCFQCCTANKKGNSCAPLSSWLGYSEPISILSLPCHVSFYILIGIQYTRQST